MNIEQLKYVDIRNVFIKSGYAFFSGKYNLNIFGIRSENRNANYFDDYLCIAYQSVTGREELCTFPATLDPGLPWLLSPMNPGGAAAICPGQYRQVWRLGQFRNRPALIQINNFKIYRDSNRDAILDLNPSQTTTGLYGIFLHSHMQKRIIAYEVGTSSAGCVVPQSDTDFDKTISLCRKQVGYGHGDKFTFTLFESAKLCQEIPALSE